MRIICHIMLRSAWEQTSGSLHADSLKTEGFIHCSNPDQVAWAANTFYAQADEVVVLCLDAARVGSPLLDEDPGCGQKFPHVYGPIALTAVVEVRPLARGSAGRWVFAS